MVLIARFYCRYNFRGRFLTFSLLPLFSKGVNSERKEFGVGANSFFKEYSYVLLLRVDPCEKTLSSRKANRKSRKLLLFVKMVQKYGDILPYYVQYVVNPIALRTAQTLLHSEQPKSYCTQNKQNPIALKTAKTILHSKQPKPYCTQNSQNSMEFWLF